jgi:hypothetical protein
MNFQTEGDWACPKCGGVEFYKIRRENKVTAARLTQFEDVRQCAKCDIDMVSPSTAKVQNSMSSCTTTLGVLAFLGFALAIILSMFGL